MFAILFAILTTVAVDVTGTPRHRRDTFTRSRLGLTPPAAFIARKARKKGLREEARREIEAELDNLHFRSTDQDPPEAHGWLYGRRGGGDSGLIVRNDGRVYLRN